MLSSVRVRLTLWCVGVLAVLTVGFALLTYLLVARNLDETFNNNLEEVWRTIEADLKKEEADIAAERLGAVQPKDKDELDEDEESPTAGGEEPLTIEAAIAEEITDLRSRDYGILVLGEDGRSIASTGGDVLPEAGPANLQGEVSFLDLRSGDGAIRMYRKAIELDGKRFQLIVTRSLRELDEFLAGLRRIFFAVLPVSLLFAGLGGYVLARRSLAPVVEMSEQAAVIGSSNLNERLRVRNESDELGSLARVFNDLLTRLEQSFQQQKRFMADASHELRTPLAIIRGESQIALSKEDRPASEYRESLSIVHDESKRLTKIVEDLFILARADSGQLKPNFVVTHLDEILIECVRVIGTLARDKDISIEFSVPDEMPVAGDDELLHRLFLNLIDNAIKYSPAGGKVRLETQAVGDSYLVAISDTGAGIDASDQPKIFDRFYRADRSRTRDNANGINGVGLGLSIAAWIAEVHRGSIRLVKSDSAGSVFQVELPRTQTRA